MRNNVNNKSSTQPVLPHNLRSVFVVIYLVIMMNLVLITGISGLFLVSVAAQACLSLTGPKS